MTINQISTNTAIQTINSRRVRLASTAVIFLFTIIAAISLLFSPIGRRWQANQTAVSPTIGATDIIIQADSNLNHLFSPAVTQVEAGTAVTWHF